jgi:putative ATP-dependent endonuclease of OLD family
MAPIVARVKELNASIEALNDVQDVRSDIRGTIKDAAGETYSPASLSIRSDLPDEADKLFQSLRLFVGESDEQYEGAIHELSLGGANLIYLTLKLLEFKYQKARESIANFLLIEEPEAHIHTHIQKTLFDRIAYSDTQIIYSTHSTHISEVSKISSVNILGRNGVTCEAYQPATGLTSSEIGNVQRYLDAVRSNLLFAKSVVLVEGDAEEILLPILFKKVVGLSLDELGISLINIRSTGFKNVALLFHNQRIRKRCSIITDLDRAFVDTTPSAADNEAEARFKRKCAGAHEDGAARKVALDAFVAGNQWLAAYYATHTFEVDFILAGNAEDASIAVPLVYVDPATRIEAEEDLRSGDLPRAGRRMLRMASHEGKGWFAILMGQVVSHVTSIPRYVIDAIFFARPTLSNDLYVNIYSYRVNRARETNAITVRMATEATELLQRFRAGHVNLGALKAGMIAVLPGDQIHDILMEVA